MLKEDDAYRSTIDNVLPLSLEHVNLVCLNNTGFIEKIQEKSHFPPSRLAKDLQSSAKLKMSILPSYYHSLPLALSSGN